jgi:hypothetical protein
LGYFWGWFWGISQIVDHFVDSQPLKQTIMAMTTTYREVNLDTLDYKKELKTNQNTGAKTVYMSTVPGSNDPSHKLRFQLGTTDELLRAVYGLSIPLPGQDERRRALDLSIDNDELLDFLKKLDEKNINAAVDNSPEWFKKQMDKNTVCNNYTALVKMPNKAEYRPTVKTKVVVDSNNNTNIYVVRSESGGAGSELTYTEGSINDITKGCKCLAVVEAAGLWFAQKAFGMSLVCTHLLIWPSSQKQGIGAFNLGGFTPRMEKPVMPNMPGMQVSACNPMNGMYCPIMPSTRGEEDEYMEDN